MPSSRTSRRAGAALALAAALGLGGCDGAVPGDAAVALKTTDGEPGDALVDGALDDEALASAPEPVRACLTRNDDVMPVRNDREAFGTWHVTAREGAIDEIVRLVDERVARDHRKRVGTKRSGFPTDIAEGFLGYDLDFRGSRLIMQVDPAVIAIPGFQRWADGVARTANREFEVPDPAVGVTVQPGCFSVDEIGRLQSRLAGDKRVGGFSGTVALDGRIHAAFCTSEQRAYAAGLQREVGPILAVDSGPCLHHF